MSKNLKAEEFKATSHEEMHGMITSKNQDDTNTDKHMQWNGADFIKFYFNSVHIMTEILYRFKQKLIKTTKLR